MVLNNEYAGVKWHRLDRGPAVRLRAFDVDDATPADFDSDGIINEHPGKGNDNGYLPHEASIAGRFVTTHASAVTLELNANGEAVTRKRETGSGRNMLHSVIPIAMNANAKGIDTPETQVFSDPCVGDTLLSHS